MAHTQQSAVRGGDRSGIRSAKQSGIRSGFTLVEVLIVILIIGILASILIPVISGVRKAGYAADSAAQITAIRAGIETYHATFGAYPGPLSDEQMYGLAGTLPAGINGTNVTGAENLILGLLGGISPQAGSGGLKFQYDLSLVGGGPRSLNPNNPKQYTFFYSEFARQISEGKWSQANSTDTNIPEFLDRFVDEPMPVLYMRARTGAQGIISASGSNLAQYDLRSILPYTTAFSNLTWRKGLTDLGNANDALSGTGINQAVPYFRDPSVPNLPRSKDTYILISPGKDRIYGTMDDITSFGNLGD